MPTAARDHRTSKSDILRAVYEENLRVSDPSAPPPRRPAVSRRPAEAAQPARGAKLTPLVLLFACVAAVLLGLVMEGFRPDAARELPALSKVAQATERPAILVPGGLAVPGGLLSGDPALLPIADLFNLHVNTIVIDPGHGGRDPGALGAEGTREKDITLDLALRLRNRLRAHQRYEVLLTRDGDESVALGERVAFANERGADLFVSLHVNWIPDAAVAPLETYYFGMEADAGTLHLAHGENSTSEYSVAEFNQMLQRAGNTVKFQESRELAEAIQESLLSTVRQTNERVRDWGVKAGPFVVLLGVEAPAVLAEVAALSNPDDESRLNTDAHREALARALEEGIVAYLDARPLPSPPLANAPTPKTPDHGHQEENL